MAQPTIAAIATATGAAGIGIIRISGSEAESILKKVFQPLAAKEELLSHQMYLGWLIEENDRRLDQILAVIMRAPHSYTGEDVVELHCHGGNQVLQNALLLTLQQGAILAQPGEFTQRAFLNGKLDLAQAEAVIDLIEAKSKPAEQIAAAQLAGLFSQKIAAVQNHLLDLTAMIEADIDYPEEEVEVLSMPEMASKLQDALAILDSLLKGAQAGRIYKEGIQTALVGKPNVGKSSLLNALLAEERALVSDIPGTTRDTIEEELLLDGIPLKLLDTAGLREEQKADPIEALGMKRAKEKIAQAQLVLWLVETASFTAEDAAIGAMLQEQNRDNVYLLLNKTDLQTADSLLPQLQKEYAAWPIIGISAKTGAGLEQVTAQIKKDFMSGALQTDEQILVANFRQQNALQKARDHMEDALCSLTANQPLDMVNIDLYAAKQALYEITGEDVTEELLDAIFSRFCLGK